MAYTSDVLCLGLVVADFVCAPVEKFPEPGGLETTDQIQVTIGGCAANVSANLAKLGRQVRLVGVVGDDPPGEIVRRQLVASGVDCQALRQSNTAQTAATLVINVAEEDRRFIHAIGANAELSGLEISDEQLAETRILYVGGFGLNPELSSTNVSSLFERARRQNVITVLDVVLKDPQRCKAMLPTVLPLTDYFLPNSDEARLLTDAATPKEQATLFQSLGAKTVIITNGKAGALAIDKAGGHHSQSAYAVVQVDGTGGGDAFAAGLMHGLLEQQPFEVCLEWASALGASCVQGAGATAGVFDARQLQSFLQDHSESSPN